MKHKLLFALAGAIMMSVSAFAADLADPVAPTRPVYPAVSGNWVAPTADGVYYIYNVGAGQFLGCGFNWGTRAVTTNERIQKLTDSAWGTSENKQTALPFKLEFAADDIAGVSGPWYYLVRQNSTGGQGPYLCHEGNEAWVDGTEGRRDADYNGFWRIDTQSDGSYLLKPYDLVSILDEEGLPTYDDDGNEIKELTPNFFGLHNSNMTDTSSRVWTDRANDATSYDAWKFIDANTPADAEAVLNDETAKAQHEAEMAEYNALLEVYNARVDLKNAIAEGEQEGIDVADAISTYNNDAATAAQLKKAASHIRALIAGQSYDFSGASENNPIDVTDQVLKNPTFDSNIDNWTITVGGQNLQWQKRTDGKVDESKNWVQITNFIEAWIPSPSHLGDGTISQTIYGLPSGKYVLECDAMATLQGGSPDPESAVEGAYIFIQTENNEIREPIKAPDTQPKHWSVVLISDGSDWMTFGLKVENTTANWISADNFKLTYYGVTEKSLEQIILEETIASAEEKTGNMVGNNIEDNSVYNINKEVGDAFTAALESANSALSGTPEEMAAANEALKQAMKEADQSYATYKAYQEVFNDALLTAQRLTQTGQWQELQDEISDYAEVELAEAFNAGTLTEEGLAEAQDKIYNMIVDYVGDGSNIQPGDDLTLLIKNADFSKGSGRDLTGDAVPGWTVVNGQLTELSGTFHNIERFHGAVNIQQTIKNLPAGSYSLGVQGFVRIDGGENDMVLYAGISTKHFKEITDESSDEPLLGDGSGNWPADSPNNVLGGYMPNSMEGAGIYFATENPATGKPFYLNEVNIVHTGGDLTIGVKCEQTNLWILWDNFTLQYLSPDAIVGMIEEIQLTADEMEEASWNNRITASTTAAIEELNSRVERADDITSMEEATALLNDLKAMINQISADEKAYQALENEIALRNQFNDESPNDDLATAIEIADDHIGAEDIESVEQIQSLIQGMREAMHSWHQPFTDKAMEGAEAGTDVTAVILNPALEIGGDINEAGEEGPSAKYWETNVPCQNLGFQNNAVYNNEEDGVKLQNFIEAWHPSNSLGDGRICQYIGVLPEGNYQLEVDAHAVNQAGEPDGGVQGVYLFAENGSDIAKSAISTSGNSAHPEHYTIGFHSNGTDGTIIGILVEGANCNWLAADNFKLVYFADQEPTAVDAIEVKAVAPKAIYTIDGRRTNALRRGINIVRKADGSVEKVLVK